jgi:hypothetical protein
MELTLSTPALLFPAISLLLLAYTNRFLSLASLIRDLNDRWNTKADPGIAGQISNLKRRVKIIKKMQILGVLSFLFCVLSMLLIFLNMIIPADIVFAVALVLLLLSLAFSVQELFISADALDILLEKNQSKTQKQS